ncbi:L,D-transpeptidase [Evansella cellulosilytica]|uniref:ErfK/YbiS/YcfS/YnhG family protein n=1 Tax=Evansella cellulosilytica (strain ATCC 21833 / DSM 2522 / FERM P-1141 / JCM 9156 / N-4) TaxID=649639 RepID=E6TXT0_EVAC2|nr:L,D-transpeptidase [Evansella cellulosilytica]ADU30006.1 ErfK/YbiS/YcfS/YnhG family protein [Evansella cellulosilytica DSM 2522]
MKFILLSLMLITSPIWPIGTNPTVGDPYIIVNKSTNELAFIIEGEVRQIYEIATGKTNEHTPEGEYNIIVKAVDPYYRKKDIEGGDKNNPLGTRWIGFDAEETDGRTYGIHGTNNPDSIGQYVTLGCIRLKNEDVEILYDQVPIGMKILVASTDKTFEELGRERGAIAKQD